MRPAFSSTLSASAFGLLLLGLLVSPLAVKKSWLPPREQSYAIQGWENGPYPWLCRQIFEEKGGIDIAFMGSSKMMYAIDTPYVEARLSERLGRKAVVRSICWFGSGFDALYLIAQDLLEHRKVRMIVFCDEERIRYRNPQASLWFRYGDNSEALAGLPLREKALYYFVAIIGMPRNLLGMIRPNLPTELISAKPNYIETNWHSPNPATRLGCVSAKLCSTASEDKTPFIPFEPHTDAGPADVLAYSPANQARFHFLEQPIPAWQLHFAKKFAALANQCGSTPVLLSIPFWNKTRPSVILERTFWPEALQNNLIMLGIPPARFFSGLSDEEIYRLCYDTNAGQKNSNYTPHLNQNGQEYFTRLVTPALLDVYESSTNR